MTDLATFFAEALARLPTEEDEDLTLTAATTGEPPAELETDRLLLRASFPGHIYHPSTRCDGVDFFGDKPTYRALGLLIFASIFHQSRTRLRLSCQEGEDLNGVTITDLVIDSRASEGDGPMPDELLVVPSAYGYWPTPPSSRNPLHDPTMTWRDLPSITWSNEDEMLVGDVDWETRSWVHGFGLPFGAARIAALFLDVGLPSNDLTEFALEGPAGFQSVTALSAEARIWVGYDYS